jgi:hypothetical protein
MGDFHPELQINGFSMFSLIASISRSILAIDAAVSEWV